MVYSFFIDKAMETDEKLRGFTVGSVPTVIYIPDFINDAEQTQLFNHVVYPSLWLSCIMRGSHRVHVWLLPFLSVFIDLSCSCFKVENTQEPEVTELGYWNMECCTYGTHFCTITAVQNSMTVWVLNLFCWSSFFHRGYSPWEGSD